MARRPAKDPSYRLHKQSGQAVVTLTSPGGQRKDYLLGPYDSPESWAEYNRLLTEWKAQGRRYDLIGSAGAPAATPDITVNEVVLAYLNFAETYYRHADGTSTSEVGDTKKSVRPLRELYGHTLAREFGPKALKALRERMIEEGGCRRYINQRIGRVKRAFKWAVSEELIPPSIFHGMQSVGGLKAGRSAAKESKPVKPVADDLVEKTLPHLNRHLRAMVQLQRLTGARPGEVAAMRTCDLDMSGSVWVYVPRRHKTTWRGHQRAIAIGPRAQDVLKPFLRPDQPEREVFCPREARAETYAAMRTARKSKVQPSQRCRRKANPKKGPREAYTTRTYGEAVRAACERHGIESWHPHQLRDSAATEIRKRFGLEGARAALGHQTLIIAETYAERDLTLAARIAAELG